MRGKSRLCIETINSPFVNDEESSIGFFGRFLLVEDAEDAFEELFDGVETFDEVRGLLEGLLSTGGGAFHRGEEFVHFLFGFKEHARNGLFRVVVEELSNEGGDAHVDGGLTTSVHLGDLLDVATVLLDVREQLLFLRRRPLLASVPVGRRHFFVKTAHHFLYRLFRAGGHVLTSGENDAFVGRQRLFHPSFHVGRHADLWSERFKEWVAFEHVETRVRNESSTVQRKEDALFAMTKDHQVQMLPFLHRVQHLRHTPSESKVGTESVDAGIHHAQVRGVVLETVGKETIGNDVFDGAPSHVDAALGVEIVLQQLFEHTFHRLAVHDEMKNDQSIFTKKKIQKKSG